MSTITRTPIINDDGTGTTGTILDNAWKQELYNQIDAVVANVPASLTAHGVVIGQGSSPIAATAPGTSGQVLTSQGASADPVFATIGKTILQIVTGTGGADFSTSSGTHVDVPNVKLTLTASGGDVLVMATVPVKNSGPGNATFSWAINGTWQGIGIGMAGNTLDGQVTLFTRFAAMTGATTIQLRVGASAGQTVTMNMGSQMNGTILGLEIK